MKWDPNRIGEILSQPDEALKPKARAVMAALGLSAEQEDALFSDWEGLREKAASVDEEDFKKVRLLLGDSRLEELVALLEADDE